MTAPRPYRPQPMSVEEAVKELHANSGAQFHPDAVRALVDILREQGLLRTKL